MILLLCLCTLFAYADENKKQTRVYVDIVGDLFHAGHIQFIKQARQFGDYLIVGIHSDDTVQGYKRQPVLTMEERASIISACRYVDEIFLDAPLWVSEELLEKLNVDIVVHGDDFNKNTLNSMYQIPIQKGIFRTVPYTQGISTSDIIGRIITRYDNGEYQKKE